MFHSTELQPKLNKINHQKEISNLFKNHQCIKNQEIINELPKNAIPCFSESYLIKRGLVITTGLDINITKKDADFIRTGDTEIYEQEIRKIVEIIGLPGLYNKIKNIIKWVASNHYESEKDTVGSIQIQVDYTKFLTKKNELKVGNTWYLIPKELLN